MTPQLKRRLFPLSGPRWLSLAFHPVTVITAAVDGYFEAFFMALTPPAAGTVSLEDACFPDRKPRLTFFTKLPGHVPEEVQDGR